MVAGDAGRVYAEGIRTETVMTRTRKRPLLAIALNVNHRVPIPGALCRRLAT